MFGEISPKLVKISPGSMCPLHLNYAGHFHQEILVNLFQPQSWWRLPGNIGEYIPGYF